MVGIYGQLDYVAEFASCHNCYLGCLMDAALGIYILYAAILSAGLVCAVLLFVLVNQYRCNKSVSKATLVLTVMLNTVFIAKFWEPVVSALVVIPSMCEEFGGLHIHEKVPANGFFTNAFREQYLTKYGYSFVEYVDYANYKKRYVTKRIRNNEDIELDDSWKGDEPQSRYLYKIRQPFETEKTGMLKYFNVQGVRDYVYDVRKNKVIGEIKKYQYGGSEFQYAMYRLLADSKKNCWAPERDPKGIPLPVYVLTLRR